MWYYKIKQWSVRSVKVLHEKFQFWLGWVGVMWESFDATESEVKNVLSLKLGGGWGIDMK